METIEIYASSAGVGQLLTHSFEASVLPVNAPVGDYNRVSLDFRTSGTLPSRIEWKLERSPDGGATWEAEDATVHWSGTVTRSRMVSTRPGTSRVSVELPSGGCGRILARRNGGGIDTRVLAVATFERSEPSHRSARGESMEARPAVPRRDVWGRPIRGAEAAVGRGFPGGRRSY